MGIISMERRKMWTRSPPKGPSKVDGIVGDAPQVDWLGISFKSAESLHLSGLVKYSGQVHFPLPLCYSFL